MSEAPANSRGTARRSSSPSCAAPRTSARIDISKLRAQTGLITLDYGYMNTGATESAITFIDGDAGILRYRGYDIESSPSRSTRRSSRPRASLIYGELPTAARARRVQPPDPPAHAPARRREALLRRLPEGRAPDGDARRRW